MLHARVERPARPSLRAVERLLPAFDLTLAQRLTFKGFFLARYGTGGTCADLLRLVHDFHEDFFDQYLRFTARRTPYDAQGRYVPEENWLGRPELTALDDARREFTGRMRALWETHGDAEEIRLDDAFVSAVAARLEPIAPHFAPYGHFLQLARGDAGAARSPCSTAPTATCPSRSAASPTSTPPLDSRWRSGCAPTPARFGRTARSSPRSPGAGHQQPQPARPDDRLRDRLPRETGAVPEEYRLHLDDLYLEHDTARDRLVLRSRRLGREVIPVYLGYLVPMALPDVPRTLLLLSPSSMAPVNPWGGVPEEPGPVTRRPRVRLGDIVLSRRSWAVAARDLPARVPGTGTPNGSCPGSGGGTGTASPTGSTPPSRRTAPPRAAVPSRSSSTSTATCR
ncbi:lantibiotic dehydratase [Streptomyces sp. M19]